MKVAVIGSGIAGLASAWHLSQQGHDVTIFEKAQRLGMGSHAIEVSLNGKKELVDVPLRIFSECYYPNLATLYKTIGVEFVPENYETTFADAEADSPYFKYHNLLFGTISIPYVSFSMLSTHSLSIIAEYLRFSWRSGKDLQSGALAGLTLAEYCKQQGFSTAFVEGLLVPVFASICTCSSESVRAYPAEIIISYMKSRSMKGVRRAVGGTHLITKLLAANCRVMCGVSVDKVTRTQGGVDVRVAGADHHFEHAVIATQANQALKIVHGMEKDEEKALSAFVYENAPVVVHSDPKVMPKNKDDWCSCNIIRSGTKTPMLTVWVNRAHSRIPSADGTRNIFQTWNPTVEIAEEHVISRAYLQRPVVTHRSVEALSELEAVQGRGNIWYSGSYSLYGMPLLETAVTSGLQAAERISGVPRPWPVEKAKAKHPGGVDRIFFLLFGVVALVATIIAFLPRVLLA